MKKSAKTVGGKTNGKPVSTAPAPTDEIARTIRMPRHLWEAASEHSSAMTARGRGRWSTNLVVVDAISQASKKWDAQRAAAEQEK